LGISAESVGRGPKRCSKSDLGSEHGPVLLRKSLWHFDGIRIRKHGGDLQPLGRVTTPRLVTVRMLFMKAVSQKYYRNTDNSKGIVP
jgi:hypothetical protein